LPPVAALQRQTQRVAARRAPWTRPQRQQRSTGRTRMTIPTTPSPTTRRWNRRSGTRWRTSSVAMYAHIHANAPTPACTHTHTHTHTHPPTHPPTHTHTHNPLPAPPPPLTAPEHGRKDRAAAARPPMAPALHIPLPCIRAENQAAQRRCNARSTSTSTSQVTASSRIPAANHRCTQRGVGGGVSAGDRARTLA